MSIRTLSVLLVTAVIVVLIIVAVFQGDIRQQVTRSNNTTFDLDVAAGRVANHSALRILGRNPVVDVGTPEDLWDFGGDFPADLAAPETLSVVSSSNQDRPLGTGAASLHIAGLDHEGRLLEETVALNGTTPASTEKAFARVNFAKISGVGRGNTTGFNAGDITVTAPSAGSVQAHIAATLTRTQMGRYTVPKGETLAIHSATYNINQPGDDPSASAIFVLWRVTPEGVREMLSCLGTQSAGDGHLDQVYSPPLVVPAGHKVFVTVSAATTNMDLSAELGGVVLQG